MIYLFVGSTSDWTNRTIPIFYQSNFKFKAMKIFQKTTALCLSLLLSIGLMAFTPPSNSLADDPNTEIRQEIIKLIDTPDLKDSTEESLVLNFMVTKAKEVIVLDVETERLDLENYIKTKLNYQDIKTDQVQINVPYSVKITFMK